MDNKMSETIENTGLIAISKTLARAKDGMSMQERKLASIYLSKLEWKNLNNNLEIWVEKSEIMQLLGSKMDSTDWSPYLRNLAQNMVRHSELHFDGEDGEWDDMPLFARRKSTKNMLMIKIYDDAAKLLQGLECDYITLFLSDILNFTPNIDGTRAYRLYEYLRLHSDTRIVNTRVISTKEFKELFDIPKDGQGSYMHFDPKKEKYIFDRTNFEKYVLNPIFDMVGECNHVVLHNYGTKNEKPIYYRKIKKHNLVQGYEVTYSINKLPHKIKRETIIDVQKNPVVLKIAQDILDSKKKQSEQQGKQNTPHMTKSAQAYNNYSQRQYTQEELDELEAKLLELAVQVDE